MAFRQNIIPVAVFVLLMTDSFNDIGISLLCLHFITVSYLMTDFLCYSYFFILTIIFVLQYGFAVYLNNMSCELGCLTIANVLT